MLPLKTIVVTATTASIEIENNSCYYNDFSFHVFINGQEHYREMNLNVINLYKLIPGTDYTVTLYSLSMETLGEVAFSTPGETLCLNPRDFGAIGDGIVDDTEAVQAAIMTCPSKGRVFISRGHYRVKPLFLKSHITLELEKGALLSASATRSDYPVLPRGGESDHPYSYIGTWEGEPAPVYASVITGFHLENTALVGEGTIDGSGAEAGWWEDPKVMRGAWRPKLLFINHSRNIILQGLCFRNSPSWTIHPCFSENLTLVDLKVENPADSPNTDGINPESCRNVKIIGSAITVGDDCIAIKSGKRKTVSRFGGRAENIEIRNCLMERGHGAVVLGSEMSGGIKDLYVSRCRFADTDRGLRIKTRRGRGKDGVVENVVFENIKMNRVKTPLVMNMFYHCDPDGKTEYVWSKEKLPTDDRTPRLGDFTFKQIHCEECEVAALFCYGLPEQKIGSLHLEDLFFSFKEESKEGFPAMMCFLEPVSKMGIYINQVEKVFLKNVKIQGNKGQALTLLNIDFTENRE